jgi:hypothetical protein
VKVFRAAVHDMRQVMAETDPGAYREGSAGKDHCIAASYKGRLKGLSCMNWTPLH